MTDTERKLKLTRFLREENAVNRMKMRNREEILYGVGKTSSKNESVPPLYDGYLDDGMYFTKQDSDVRSTLGIRMVLAVILMGVVIYMDKTETTVRGEPISEIISAQIDVDIKDRMLEFVSVFNGG